MMNTSSAHLTHLGVLAISGHDRKTFLQGQLTCDLNQLATGEHTLCAQCDAKGKVLAISYLLNSGDDYLQIMRRDQIAGVLAALGKYAVFSKVELTDVSEQYPLSGFAAEPTAGENSHCLALSAGRYLVLGDATGAAAEPLSARQWEERAIQAGEPLLPAELVAEQVPQAFNLDCIDGISFTKGCYIGQETIARMHYRGGVKRRMFILNGTAEGAVTTGLELEMQLGEHWRRAGRVVRFEQQGEQLSLLALLPADISPDSRLRISGDEQSQLMLQPLPYSLSEASES